MKNLFKLSLMTMLVLAMAACNFNPADWNPGGGTGGGDGRGDGKGDGKGGGRTDVVMLRGMQGDVVTTPCDGIFMVESISVDDAGNTVVIVNVRTEDGMQSITLTKENPSFMVGGCVIHLKGVERIVSPRSDVPQLVAHFYVKKVGSDKKHDDRKDTDDRDDEGDDDEDEDNDEDSDRG
ncbi:MAG: hypothetical protein ACE364_08785 [Chlorobiota bacterium]